MTDPTSPSIHDDTTATDTSRAERYRRGAAVLDRLRDRSIQELADGLGDISPELGYQIVAWAYGEMYARPALSPRDRQLVTLGMLTSQGGDEAELQAHIPLALEAGLTPDEIVEVFLHSVAYCGFPRAINATKVAKQIFADRGRH